MRDNDGLLQADFDAFYKTSDESKLFFRFRWIYEAGNKDNNFNQIQLGYSMNLFVRGSVTKSTDK
jgi:hypothetical protein